MHLQSLATKNGIMAQKIKELERAALLQKDMYRDLNRIASENERQASESISRLKNEAGCLQKNYAESSEKYDVLDSISKKQSSIPMPQVLQFPLYLPPEGDKTCTIMQNPNRDGSLIEIRPTTARAKGKWYLHLPQKRSTTTEMSKWSRETKAEILENCPRTLGGEENNDAQVQILSTFLQNNPELASKLTKHGVPGYTPKLPPSNSVDLMKQLKLS
jgi:hypothetical protein